MSTEVGEQLPDGPGHGTDEPDESRSEGFPRAAYFVPGRDGIGVWPISEIVLRRRRRRP